jgi:hypothetical protein
MENRTWRGVPGAPGGRVSTAFFFFDLLFYGALLSSALGGCAAPGEPYERKPPTPAAITDLAVSQTGNDVVLTFTLPEQTADRRPLQRVPEIEIYRDFGKPPEGGQTSPAAAASPTLLATIPVAMENRYTEQGHIHYADSLRAEDFTGHPDSVAIYIARTQVSEKKPSANSNVASVPVYPAADPIADLKIQITHSAVVLSWTAPEKTLIGSTPAISAYRIYRAEALSGAVAATDMKLKSPLAKIGETQSAQYEDTQFTFGATYLYSVRSVVQYPGEALESANSNLAVATPRDIFPPGAPENLLVVLVEKQGAETAHLELSWAINPETDIAGYNVYRSEQADRSGNRLNTELLRTPAFRDMNVLPGHRYFYSVTAVDHAGNESPISAVVWGGVPAESQATP